MSPRRIVVSSLLLTLFLLRTAEGQRTMPPHDGTGAVGAMVADRHTADSVLYLHGLGGAMSDEERYEFLADWVLPSSSHDTIRLALDFSPTHPAPRTPMDFPGVEGSSSGPMGRLPSGGILVSPALELVELAARLRRSEKLRSRIERVMPRDELQQRCRLAMLGLVACSAGEHEQAAACFEQLFERVAAETREDFAGRWPETLAVHASLDHPRTREAAADQLFRMLQSQVRSGAARGPETWDRWVRAAAGRLTRKPERREERDTETKSMPIGERRSDWQPVSRMTAWSRGQGMPNAAWRRGPAMVENVASHAEDYLYYRIPLRGDFEVECDVTSFNWRDSHLMVAGTYVAPIYDHVSYGIGSFRQPRPNGVIEPRLSACDDWMRYRAVVRDGKCATCFNGRLIHTEPLADDHDPWLAIRSSWDADGAVRNLRITGRPTVPAEICLARDPELQGWSPYYDEPVGTNDDSWRYAGDATPGGGIVGRHDPSLTGLACERLLQYHRPMLEDGTIEYEFYYREGESAVYPALDRRAWILFPSGVQIHWITDGSFERTGLEPGNLTHETARRRGPSPLPLMENAWNRLQLVLKSHVVQVVLNGQVVDEGPLEPANQRTFGLFYWSDRTQAAVRSIVWRGTWPREVPAVELQELAGKGTRWLDQRRAELPARFEHDFARGGLPLQQFTVGDRSGEHLASSQDGVRAAIRGGHGYSLCWFGPRLQLHGDFDVTAQFEQFQVSGTPDSSTGVFLMAVTGDDQLTHSSVYRGVLRKPNTPDRNVMQVEFSRRTPRGTSMTWPASTSEECTSGTLRLARRGETIYCLLAEADSPNYRLVHKETVPAAATIPGGVRLAASTYAGIDGPCESAVTWKRLSIWSEQLTGLAAAPPRRSSTD